MQKDLPHTMLSSHLSKDCKRSADKTDGDTKVQIIEFLETAKNAEMQAMKLMSV